MDEARQREAELEGEIRKLQNRLEDATRSASSSQKAIDDLKEDNRRIDALQKINADLRSELNDQIELAQHRFMEAQYLKLEKEKLIVLSDYKDSQLVEHRAAVKSVNFCQTHLLESLTFYCLQGASELDKRAAYGSERDVQGHRRLFEPS